jgi:hypothetical protein
VHEDSPVSHPVARVAGLSPLGLLVTAAGGWGVLALAVTG